MKSEIFGRFADFSYGGVGLARTVPVVFTSHTTHIPVLYSTHTVHTYIHTHTYSIYSDYIRGHKVVSQYTIYMLLHNLSYDHSTVRFCNVHWRIKPCEY